MSKVTALGMDVITEKSGHVVTPLAPSVCTTPAAPAPLPVPYPVSGTSAGGLVGVPSRTKINGAKIGTVGGAFTAVHGNEPGTLKEVVSLATGGPAPILVGAPTAIVELGMAGITGSPLLANRGPGPSGRMAPGPMAGPASVAAVAALGGGGGSGDGDGDGDGGKGGASGGGAGGGRGGKRDGKSAPPGQPGQCSESEPVDAITGRAYTLPAADLDLPGPLPLVFSRVYSSDAAARDVGLGFGWAHSWGWEIEPRCRALTVWSDEGTATEFPQLEVGTEHVGRWGWSLRRERDCLVLDKGDGIQRVFAAVDERARRWKLIALRDRNDNRIELTYDDAGRLCEVIDSVGRTVRLVSTRAGRIGSVHVYNARSQGQWVAAARYSYDEAGNLTAAIDAEGHAARFAYDDEHRLTRKTDRCGLVFHFAYDRAGRCVETWGDYPGRRDPSLAENVPVLLADGRTRARGVHHVRLDYGFGGYTEVTDSTQLRRYFGNRHGLVDKRVAGVGIEEAAYDDRGLVLESVDEEGAVTRYERDGRGRVVRLIEPLGRVTTYERDAHGDVMRTVDAAGGVHELHRDDRGNVVQAADPTGAAWSYTRDERGLVTSCTSPTGGVTRYAHDADGNLVGRAGPDGARWRWDYDARGRCTLAVDPLGQETRVIWTERGDVAAIFDAGGGVTRYTYDGERRRLEVQGPGRHTEGVAWGGYMRLCAATNPNGDVVRLRYNREGELTEVENELGDVHRLRRDAAGRVAREETFDGRAIGYRRDHAGRVVRTDVAGEITDYTYDAAGALVLRTFSDESTEAFTYDARGDMVGATWSGGAIRLERDAAGRVVREVQVLGDEEHAVTSVYDGSGARVRRSTSVGHVEQIERDAAGARTRTILDGLHDIHHGRDPLGREVMRALPRGGRIHHAYDALGRIERRWATAPGSLLPVRFDDPSWAGAAAPGQPERITVEKTHLYDQDQELSDTLDRRRGWLQYEYDASGRLLSALRELAGELEASSPPGERFRYDAAGNHALLGEPRDYAPGGRLVRRGETSYQWDPAGGLAEKRDGDGRVWRFEWDAADRLVAVELPEGRRVAYAYDPFGRRLEARVLGARADGTRPLLERTRYVWDGDTLAHAIRARAVAEGDPIVEERTYCFEDGGFVPWAHCETADDARGVRRSAWAFYVNDPIGTPEELVDGRGEVLAELDREAWGRTEAGDGARASTPLRFQGQLEDPETGLFYNRNRYYDPDAGLYLSPDPLGLEAGLRPFGYGRNPVGWVDPLGLAWQKTEGPVCPLKERADDLHSALKSQVARNMRTTAVVSATRQNGCPVTIVASSEPTLDNRQTALLQQGEIAVPPGEKYIHAEVRALALANSQGWAVHDVAASREICGPCKAAIDGAGARTVSPLGKGVT
jgi:RHS repeat-associated protein